MATNKDEWRGIWKGVDITDEEIEEAKRSLFKGIRLDAE